MRGLFCFTLALLFADGLWVRSQVDTGDNGEQAEVDSRYQADKKLAPFFIYTDMELNSTAQLDGCEQAKIGWRWQLDTHALDYIAVGGVFLSQLLNHPSRASDPNQATWFIVPFDIDQSFWVKNCKGVSDRQRMVRALDYLENSPFYQRNHGRDHIWVAMRFNLVINKPHSFIPASHRHVVKNMVVGRYLSYHLQSSSHVHGFTASPFQVSEITRSVEEWRCTMVLPAKSVGGLFVPDQTFDKWLQRPTSIFFRGRYPKHCLRGHEVRNITIEKLQGVVPHAIIEQQHAPTRDQYKKEINGSRFCLVMGCDDVHTSRFVDSLAASCIPVVIADGWDLIAKPYGDQINYDKFTIQIPEKMWLDDPLGAAKWLYSMPHPKLRRMHRALQSVRNALLWSHPKSIVAQMAMQAASNECTAEKLNHRPLPSLSESMLPRPDDVSHLEYDEEQEAEELSKKIVDDEFSFLEDEEPSNELLDNPFKQSKRNEAIQHEPDYDEPFKAMIVH